MTTTNEPQPVGAIIGKKKQFCWQCRHCKKHFLSEGYFVVPVMTCSNCDDAVARRRQEHRNNPQRPQPTRKPQWWEK